MNFTQLVDCFWPDRGRIGIDDSIDPEIELLNPGQVFLVPAPNHDGKLRFQGFFGQRREPMRFLLRGWLGENGAIVLIVVSIANLIPDYRQVQLAGRSDIAAAKSLGVNRLKEWANREGEVHAVVDKRSRPIGRIVQHITGIDFGSECLGCWHDGLLLPRYPASGAGYRGAASCQTINSENSTS